MFRFLFNRWQNLGLFFQWGTQQRRGSQQQRHDTLSQFFWSNGNNIWQFLGIMCFLSFPGVLLPHRETKIGSASLALFRINYSPEHCVVFPAGVSSCKLWIGPAWLLSVLEIKQSVKHCVVCTVSVSGLLSRLGMGEGLLTSLGFSQTYTVIWSLKNVYLYIC